MANNNTYVTYEEDIKGVYTYSQMQELYKEEVNKEEYATFNDWFHDMLKSGVFEETTNELIKIITTPTEEIKIWKHKDYYSVSYKNADCSLSGTLEEVKEDIKSNFSIDVEIQF